MEGRWDEAALFAALVTGSFIKFAFSYFTWRKRQKSLQYVGEISELYIYPVKSCAGVKVDQVECSKLGVTCGHVSDRHWMLIDKNNKLITQRKCPRLVLVKPSIRDNALCLDAPGMETLTLKPRGPGEIGQVIQTDLFGDAVKAVECCSKASAWFSAYLKKPGCRLVYAHPTVTRRQINKSPPLLTVPLLAKPEDSDLSAFPDWAPYSLLSEASIADVNSRLPDNCKKAGVLNFRPNMVVKDCGCYEEDNWCEIYIGQQTKFRNLKKTLKCILTTVDPDTGEMGENMEPLRTLRR
ncbi:mitochondrial amidoxime reducing component 2-like [Lingula anatina]|uniref:Mitochondrial amidoxime reducing component 2-like n=1 Tax=Lingula anatina TaxID=7574 RepID=A0A1S3K1P6_LINAN|nr:mitochondrial amidoxime reducing component 2-like [Lingula anatina]|eukprot:XP_013416319.1 mitochondrial amidoxime reducing component 2-like [Lingula anatina]